MNREWTDVPEAQSAEKEASQPSGQHHAAERRWVLLSLRVAGKQLAALRIPGGTSRILLCTSTSVVGRIWSESISLPAASPGKPGCGASELEKPAYPGDKGAAGFRSKIWTQKIHGGFREKLSV